MNKRLKGNIDWCIFVWVSGQLSLVHNIREPLPHLHSAWPGKPLKVDTFLFRQINICSFVELCDYLDRVCFCWYLSLKLSYLEYFIRYYLWKVCYRAVCWRLLFLLLVYCPFFPLKGMSKHKALQPPKPTPPPPRGGGPFWAIFVSQIFKDWSFNLPLLSKFCGG